MSDIKNIAADALRARHAVMAEREDLSSRSGKVVHQGMMNCPICKKGHLKWHVMPNGHVHMDCSTETCIQWVE